MMFETERSLVRAAAALQRTDSVVVSRPVPGGTTLNPDTLDVTTAAPTQIWAGLAHCKPASGSGDVALGESSVPQRQMSVSLPPDVPLIAVNDLLTVTAAQDPLLPGLGTWRVLGVGSGGFWAAVVSLQCVQWYVSNYWTAEEPV